MMHLILSLPNVYILAHLLITLPLLALVDMVVYSKIQKEIESKVASYSTREEGFRVLSETAVHNNCTEGTGLGAQGHLPLSDRHGIHSVT